MPEASAWNAERARQIIAEHAEPEGPVLPVLHGLQEEFFRSQGCCRARGWLYLARRALLLPA
jgi:hypothetical protein